MKTMYLAVEYLAMRARSLGRTVFRSEAGALTLEWIVLAAGLVAVAIAAGAYILKKVKAEEGKIP